MEIFSKHTVFVEYWMTLRKLRVSTKVRHQEIRRNIGILGSDMAI